MARGSRISAGTGRHGGEDFNVRIVVEGAEKTSDEFKQIRRTINGRLREAMVRAGERSVLPAIKGDLPAKWGDTLFVKRDRGGVFIGSRLRGSMNRLLRVRDQLLARSHIDRLRRTQRARRLSRRGAAPRPIPTA
jgi:hypothetical protein